MTHDEPLTIEELQSLGFDIYYKMKGGHKVFSSCGLHYDKFDYHMWNITGEFYHLPTFKEIIKQVIDNSKFSTEQELKVRMVGKLTDLID